MMILTPSTIRTDAQGRACGQGFIPAGHTCHKKGAFPTRTAIAAGLGVAAVGAGVYALSRRRSTPATSSPKPVRPSGPPRLPGGTPKALLAPAPRKSKTQRMRENTEAATREAERAIGWAAEAEIKRAGAVANAMAAAGEATGMAVKGKVREIRLRTEAARRRFEPGYRRSRPAQAPSPAQFPEGGPPVRIAFTPQAPRMPAERDPRTGQPRRRNPEGFGRTDNHITFYAPVALRRIS